MKGKKIASKVLYLFLLVLTFSYSFSLGFIYERSTTYEVESNNFKYSMLSTSVKDVVEPSGNNLQLINVKTEIEEPEEIP